MNILIDPFGTIFDCSFKFTLSGERKFPLTKGFKYFRKFFAVQRVTFLVSRQIEPVFTDHNPNDVFPLNVIYYDGVLEYCADFISSLNPKIFIYTNPILFFRLKAIGFEGRSIIFDYSKILYKSSCVANRWIGIVKRILLAERD